MSYLGIKLRELRNEKGLLLREVAATIQTDAAYVSKVELGERKPKREHVGLFADIYDVSPTDLDKLWLADKVYDYVCDEKTAIESLELVLTRLKK